MENKMKEFGKKILDERRCIHAHLRRLNPFLKKAVLVAGLMVQPTLITAQFLLVSEPNYSKIIYTWGWKDDSVVIFEMKGFAKGKGAYSYEKDKVIFLKEACDKGRLDSAEVYADYIEFDKFGWPSFGLRSFFGLPESYRIYKEYIIGPPNYLAHLRSDISSDTNFTSEDFRRGFDQPLHFRDTSNNVYYFFPY
jgi:hypothetical protein